MDRDEEAGSPDPRAQAAVPEEEELVPAWPRPGYWIRVALAVIGIVVALRMVLLLQGVLLVVFASLVIALGSSRPSSSSKIGASAEGGLWPRSLCSSRLPSWPAPSSSSPPPSLRPMP